MAAGLAGVLVLGVVLGSAGVRVLQGGKAGQPVAVKAVAAPAGSKPAPSAANVEVAQVEAVLLPRGVSAVGTLRSQTPLCCARKLPAVS